MRFIVVCNYLGSYYQVYDQVADILIPTLKFYWTLPSGSDHARQLAAEAATCEQSEYDFGHCYGYDLPVKGEY